MRKHNCDIAIVGGGLAGGLIALALSRLQPDLRLTIIEEGPVLGGNHMWSFFVSDVEPADRWLIAPLVSHGWRGYDVHFPGHSRSLDTIYYSIESERLDEVLRQRLPAAHIRTGARALACSATTVVLADGTRIEAGGVIDARGLGPDDHAALGALSGGWQKFVGQTLLLDEPHSLTQPIVMDATVDQIDGYRFVYCLPLSPLEVFVEDTYYSDGPRLDQPALQARIADYATARGWTVLGITREESGVLPVASGGDFNAFWEATGTKCAKAGARAGLFHPLTSYSLPDAVRFAVNLAGLGDLSGAALLTESRRYAERHWKRGRFYRLLTAMMLEAGQSDQRYKLLERHYTLNQGLLERFYAGQSTRGDMLRELSGKPPVPVGSALAAMRRSISGTGEPMLKGVTA